MPIFDDNDFPVPSWTTTDVEILDSVDEFYRPGLINLLQYVVREQGAVFCDTLDLSLVVHSIANISNDLYSFAHSDSIVAVASEFCLVDCVYDGQVLGGIELKDNAVLFLGINDEPNYALEAAVCLSKSSDSLMRTAATLPTLSLFGHWEDFAVSILTVLLTKCGVSSKISVLHKIVKKLDIGVSTELEFVDCMRKLCAVNLLSVELNDSAEAVVSINVQPAGLFLLFSNRVELARRLAEISI